MLKLFSLNLIFLIFFVTKVLLNEQNDPDQLPNSIDGTGPNAMDSEIEKLLASELFSDVEQVDHKYGYLDHIFKFSSPLLSEKCIKFHDSEIVSVDLKQFSGRWDRHLISARIPMEYNYGLATYDEKEEVTHFKYEPMGYHSLSYVRNDTKMLRSLFVINDFSGVRLNDDEAFIGIDYKSYFLKYSCIELMGRVSHSLHLQLRPEMTAQLDSNPDLFTQILDKIPEKSLNKISHLVTKLNHQIDKRFENFGEEYSKTLTKRLEKYRKDNQLSDKSDDFVFDFLNKNCAHFKEEELIIADLETIRESNWNLDHTDENTEKIAFNRMTAQRLTNNTFTVSLFLGKKFLADSDHYFDIKARGFWTFTEGVRSLEVTLYSTHEHRIIYSCEERHIDGKLQFSEKMRYFSAENKTKSRNLVTYLHRLVEYIKPKTLVKVSHLHRHMSDLKPIHDAHPLHEEL